MDIPTGTRLNRMRISTTGEVVPRFWGRAYLSTDEIVTARADTEADVRAQLRRNCNAHHVEVQDCGPVLLSDPTFADDLAGFLARFDAWKASLPKVTA